MKLLISLSFFLLSGLLGFSQSTQRVVSSCSCPPGYLICQADAMFMSCCTCCQPGASCGSWSAFGLCGCKCEDVTTARVTYSDVKFYLNAYDDFMSYLDNNNVSTTQLRQFGQSAKTGKTIVRATNPFDDYIVLGGNENQTFMDQYVTYMKTLVKDPAVASLVDAYLNKK